MFWKRRRFFQSLGAALGAGFLQPRDALEASVGSAGSNSEALPGPSPMVGEDVIREAFDLVVVGGGIAGTSAAISAARNGVKIALIHERSMLGGNSSSEVRLFPENSTAHQVWIKECGVFEEIHTEERVRNHYAYREGTMNCHWDLVLYEWVIREPNITLFLNTHMHRAFVNSSGAIQSVYCIQLGSEKEFLLSAPLFVDATGDGVLAHRAGADYRWGREARREYREPLAPEKADENLMGSTLFFRAVDTGAPVPFKRPDWAVEFESEEEFTGRSHSYIEGGYWWIEVGTPYHPIRDNNAIIHEGLRHLLGVWDHIKNQGDHGAENYGLEFVGFWPYKRECRRILGDFVLTQQHLQDPPLSEDDVAYGVWFIDIHTRGILDRSQRPFESPFADEKWDAMSTRCYGIPLRALYSRNIGNLMMAGRPISCSYVAFSSTRVLATGSVVGQAVGAAAALCKKHGVPPREVARRHARECQQIILRQDGYIPGVVNEDPGDLARNARVTASSEASLVFPQPTDEEELRMPLGQIIPISADRIDRVDLLLCSNLDHAAELRLGLRSANHVWDFRANRDLVEAHARVPARFEGWVSFDLRARVPSECLYYIHVSAQPGVSWKKFREDDRDLVQRCPVGVTPASLPGRVHWRPFRRGCSFCMRLTPPSQPFMPQNVVRGTNRPDRWTNLWSSDPDKPLPARLQLNWPRSLQFNSVQISFDTNINRRIRHSLFRYPECVKDYTLEYVNGGEWKILLEERGNYMRRRVHRVGAVTSDRLRLTVQATNGVPNARVYEVRVYNETPSPEA
ncbi:MAG: FAD-dependent oxidoreductase [bacterium]